MLQLNTKELKNFRDTLAKWHIADFDKKDAQITRQKKIKLNEDKIADYQSDIEKLQNGKMQPIGKTVNERVAEIEAQIKNLEVENEDAKSMYSKHAESLDANFENGRSLISDDLLSKFESYLDDIYNDDAELQLLNAITEWFISHGAKGVVADDVRKYLRPLGRKGASAKKSCETNKHTTREKGKKLKDAFLGGLCDDPTLMALLPTHSWTNKIEKKAKKSDK